MDARAIARRIRTEGIARRKEQEALRANRESYNLMLRMSIWRWDSVAAKGLDHFETALWSPHHLPLGDYNQIKLAHSIA